MNYVYLIFWVTIIAPKYIFHYDFVSVKVAACPPFGPPAHVALSVCQWRIPVTMQFVPRRQSVLTCDSPFAIFSKKFSRFSAVQTCFLRSLSSLCVANNPRVTIPRLQEASRRAKVRRTNYCLQRPFTSSIYACIQHQLRVKLLSSVYIRLCYRSWNGDHGFTYQCRC